MLKAAANKQDTGKSQYFVWPKFVELFYHCLAFDGRLFFVMVNYVWILRRLYCLAGVMKEINWK